MLINYKEIIGKIVVIIKKYYSGQVYTEAQLHSQCEIRSRTNDLMFQQHSILLDFTDRYFK